MTLLAMLLQDRNDVLIKGRSLAESQPYSQYRKRKQAHLFTLPEIRVFKAITAFRGHGGSQSVRDQ